MRTLLMHGFLSQSLEKASLSFVTKGADSFGAGYRADTQLVDSERRRFDRSAAS